MENGKVWLVGAGPGEGELLTVRGQRVLQQADIVVYDALVGSGVLMQIPKEAERIYAGKRQGHHSVPQQDIQRILIDKAREGKKVVRLKGGDPFLFGRGGEELEALLQERIPCEIVPGISSALAVPAWAGIPVTHRDYASSVHIITGHRRDGKELSLDFKEISRLEGTLVFLMGVSALPQICEGLLREGMAPDTAAAVISHGTLAEQKNIFSTLSCLPQDVAGESDLTPAILVIGSVCALAETLTWKEQRILDGIRVIVTRPAKRAQVFMEGLADLGAQAIALPAVRMNPLVDRNTFFDQLNECERGQWLAFTSPTGVEIFFDCCRRWKYDIRRLAGASLAALGPGTAKALEDRGLMVDFVPSEYHGAALGRELAEKIQRIPQECCCRGQKEERSGRHLITEETVFSGMTKKVLIPRAKDGNPELIRELEEREVTAEELILYETIPEEITCEEIYQELLRPEGLLLTFTSGSTVRCFIQNACKALNRMPDWTKYRAVCIGRQTADVAAEYGMDVITAEQPTVESMLEAVQSILS